MSAPSPALVSQNAVRRLPRWALLCLLLAYILPGYIGRDPWKNADIASFGVMQDIAAGQSSWLAPSLLGQALDQATWLPYWLGALSLQLAPAWLRPEWAVRLPFMLLLAATFWLTWLAMRNLALSPGALPVSFAFGGEAHPQDYARVLADGCLLALVATLGLAQFSHETAPALTRLFCITLAFYGASAVAAPRRAWQSKGALLAGLLGLATSGGPGMALLFSVGMALALALHPAGRQKAAVTVLLLALAAIFCAWIFWQVPERANSWRGAADDWRALGQLLLWFVWPVWFFALWTLWHWRRQLWQLQLHPHLAIPVFFALVPLLVVCLKNTDDRTLLLAMPALAALATLALPTLKRSASALVDWFSVLFFSGGAIVIWVVWISMQTGIPAKPAANVARLGPGFVPSFNLYAFVAALAGTLAWLALARWRTARNRPALWKSLVLPAAGTTLCWLLLMSLWLPALNYGRSYRAQMQALTAKVQGSPCVAVHALNNAQITALRYFNDWPLARLQDASARPCPWLLAGSDSKRNGWQLLTGIPRPTSRHETIFVYRRSTSR